MGRTSRTEEEIVDIRNRVLDAAVTLFCDKGYQNTPVVDVAKASDYSVPTLYKYFTNKEALVEGILLRLFAKQQEMFVFDVPSDLNMRERIELLFRHMMNWATKHQAELIFISNNLPATCQEMSNGINPHLLTIAGLQTWLNEHTTERERSGLTPYMLAKTMMGHLHIHFEIAIEEGNIDQVFSGTAELIEILFTRLEN